MEKQGLTFISPDFNFLCVKHLFLLEAWWNSCADTAIVSYRCKLMLKKTLTY